MDKIVKGYKVFNSDWTCRDKQYTCPGTFEEDIELDVCRRGLHFCKKAIDCFNYYSFSSNNHVAEVIAYGDVKEFDNKCCTNKLKIVRELSWHEVLDIVNTGENCTGYHNSGDYNSGHHNSGDYNSGYRNSGDYNSGHHNSGDYNSGYRNSSNCNSGNYNSGYRNSGHRNSGDLNSGNCNSGNYNSGEYNSGGWNSGHYNSGDHNSGHYNSGDWNSGDYNNGNCNSGDWNKTNHSNGCFNTIQPKIKLFNKESDLTYNDWFSSDARKLLNEIPTETLKWAQFINMSEEEKKVNPDAEDTDGYLKMMKPHECAQDWWNKLEDTNKKIILDIPNFDKEIFKEITGIDVNMEVKTLET